MKHIISAYGTMFILMLNIIICISICNASIAVAEAKEFKADVIAEIENSNFNIAVINGCIAQANEAGYILTVTNCVYDENNNIQTAEVILNYTYKIPLLGISEIKMTRGIARWERRFCYGTDYGRVWKCDIDIIGRSNGDKAFFKSFRGVYGVLKMEKAIWEK